MPVSMRLNGWSRPALVAAVLAVSWLCWPLGLALLAVIAWTGRSRRLGRGWGVRTWPYGNPFDLFWRRFYRIESPEDDRIGGETPPSSGPEEGEFAEYLERLRRARDGARNEPVVTGRDRAGFA